MRERENKRLGDQGNEQKKSAVIIRILLLFLPVLLSNCQPERTVQPAFYHWQTAFSLSDFEKNYLDSLGVKKLYVKFFDVDWDDSQGIPVPLAAVEIEKSEDWNAEKLEIIPCIFITNRTFQNISDAKIEWLSNRVEEKLFTLKPVNITFKEIQFDCDWTTSTRDRFFKFLEIFKKSIDNQDIKLSATIRLHQFRDFQETGIPPVDRGMLMFYNTGEVEDWQEENSILNLEVAKSYLPASRFGTLTSRFPLPLDLALPIFHWGVLFRDHTMIRLINNLENKDLQDTLRFSKIGNNRFEIIKSTYLNGYYLYEGDLIRTETIDTQLLLKSTALLADEVKTSNGTVAFYHLDTATIKHFPHAFLEKIVHKIRSQ